jgi:TolA-binding protein
MGQTNNDSGGNGLTPSQLKVLAIYDKARADHLNENFVKARNDYQELMSNKQISSIGDAARFFYGVTYFNQHRYAAAEKYFKSAIAEPGSNLWVNSEYRFLAESLIAQGKISEGKTWLAKADSWGAQTRLRNLDQNEESGLTTAFISY